MINLTLLLCILISFLNVCGAYKLLVVYPFPAKSHNILGNGAVKHLLKAGHEVTYITPFPLKNDHPKLKQIDVSDVINAFQADVVNIKALIHNEVDLNDDNGLYFTVVNVSNAVIKNRNVQELLNDPDQHFDLVVNEWMFNELYAGFSVVFNCPYIWTFPYEPIYNVLSLIDEAPNPAYIPTMVSSNVPPFSFRQRVQELYRQSKAVFLKLFSQLPFEEEVYIRVFTPIVKKRGRTIPPYSDLRLNASMILGSSHVSMGQAMRLPQNFKSIAGYYIDDVLAPLPDDLQKLMDNAKEGVIYFSLGSNLKSKDLPDSIKKGLVNMFGELKEEVLWKFEDDTMTSLPKNVHIIKWAPQQSVLAHPNCKVFVTHGGLLSMTEAVHFGVPIVGIPVFVDQFNNVDRAVQKGLGKRVDISYELADDLGVAIREIAGNHKFATRAKELSLIFHDRPVSPQSELVHWVEHVIRTRGAYHLRSPALHVPLYQKLYLDLAIVVLVMLILIIRALKFVISMSFPKKASNMKKKRN